MTRVIHTAIEIWLKLLVTFCLLKEVADKHIRISDKIFNMAQQIFSNKVTVFSIYQKCLMNDTAAHEITEMIDSISDALLMKMVVSYYRKYNVKLYQYKAINGVEGTTEFQVFISDKVFTRTDYELYNQMFEGKSKDKLFSAFSNIVIHYFFKRVPSVGITTPGSKVQLCRMLDISKIPELKYIIEPFARTCSFSLALRDKSKEFILNDKDIEVVNYLTCLKECPIYLINAIIKIVNSDEFKQLRDAAHEKVMVRKQLKEAHAQATMSEQKGKADKAFTSARDEYIGKLSKKLQDDSPEWLDELLDKEHINKKWRGITHSSIQKAAYFFIIINITYSGDCKSINHNRIDGLANSLKNKFPRMLSAAGVLQRAKIFHNDYSDIMKKYGALDDALFLLDPPYITDKGEDDKTYNFTFNIEDMKHMASLAQDISHVIVTHKTLDTELVRELFLVSDGYSIVNYSNNYCKNNSYTTDVFYKGISADVFAKMGKGDK